jgi:hypothetical protein
LNISCFLPLGRVYTRPAGRRNFRGSSLPVYCDMPLAAELAPVRRIRPCLFAPRWLAALAPSMLTRLQSMASYPRNRASNARCRRSHTPSLCQSRSRRQHVMPLPKPISCGKSSHGMPACSTNRMPFSADRSSTRGRPPLAERAAFGSSGSSVPHKLSLILRLVIRLQTLCSPCRMTGFVGES